MMHTIPCPKCNKDAEVKELPTEQMQEVTVHCDNCGDNTFLSMEVPKMILFKFVQYLIKTGRDHQNHTIGGMMARQHFITTHHQEFPLDDYRRVLEYGDAMFSAAEDIDPEQTDPGSVVATMYAYQSDLEDRRAYQMAMCKCIADLKLVKVPESCYQDFCEDNEEGEGNG